MDHINKLLNDIRHYDVEIAVLQEEADYFSKIDTEDARLRVQQNRNTIARMAKEKIAVSNAIDRLSDPITRIVMKRRYILGEQWWKIARCCNQCERNLRYIKKNTLDEFARIFREEMKNNDEM